jgi:uncharacterized membrane protein YgaE (UPF0421/DUF939 family)
VVPLRYVYIVAPMIEVNQGRARAVTCGWARIRASFSPIAQAALAAAVAWFIADHTLRHPDPIFAPIAAAITLSTTRVLRVARIAQLLVGVLLGIAIGAGLSAVLGTSAVALGLIVFVAFAVAVMSGDGLLGEGLLFANQAAASAILVVTLSQHGAGGDRALDALVGGAVALVVAVLMFPTEPLSLLAGAERRVLRSLAETLQETAGLLATDAKPRAGWLRARRADGHKQLEVLNRSCATARTSVRVAPRRWRLRAVVALEIGRLTQMDALVDSVGGLARTAISGSGASESLPAALQHEVALLGSALCRLGNTEQPWPAELLDEVRAATDDKVSRVASEPADRAIALESLLDATAADIAAVTGVAGPSPMGDEASPRPSRTPPRTLSHPATDCAGESQSEST